MIFATSFNISSDLMLLLIPLPIIVRTRLPLRRQAITPPFIARKTTNQNAGKWFSAVFLVLVSSMYVIPTFLSVYCLFL